MKHTAVIFTVLAGLLLLVQGCSVVQFAEPTGKEKPGAVGMSFYFMERGDDGTRNLMAQSRLTGIYLSEVGKDNKPIRFVDLKENQAVYLHYTQVVITGLDPKKTYAIRYIDFEQKVDSKRYIQWGVQPSTVQAAKVAPIQLKPGKFEFIGVIGVELKIQKFLGRAVSVDSTKISKDPKPLTKFSEDGLWGGYATWAKQNAFGYGKSRTLKAARIFILENFEKSQKSPYWKAFAKRSMK